MFSYELYDDVTAEERAEIVALESAEIALDRAVMAYDVIMESRDLQLREAELKCFAESGDVNKLIDFYEAAEENTEEKKKGLVATIWDKIVAFINKILGKEVKKNEEETYVVSSNMPKAIQALKNAVNAVSEFITNPIKAIFTKGAETWKKLVGILEGIAITAVVIVGGKAAFKAIKGKTSGSTGETVVEMKGSEINKEVKGIKALLKKMNDALGKNKDNIGKNVGSDNEGIVGKICSTITKKANDITSLLNNAVSKAGEVVRVTTSKVSKGAKGVVKAAKSVDGAVNGETDEATTESAEDFEMTKDFADILAAQPYEEACDTSELEEMLSGLI